MKEKTIAIVGLDTSHAVEFAKLIQHPRHKAVEGLRVTRAFRYPSAFYPEAGQDERQAELAGLGVTMAPTLTAAVDGVDAIFLEINDPALHLEYFEQVVHLRCPIFIDKPLAATNVEGRRIRALAEQHGTPTWSSSSLRFLPSLQAARAQVPAPLLVHTFGALGWAAQLSAATGQEVLLPLNRDQARAYFSRLEKAGVP